MGRTCRICEKNVTNRWGKIIKCNICSDWFHINCVDMDETQLDYFKEELQKEDGEKWLCVHCISSVSSNIDCVDNSASPTKTYVENCDPSNIKLIIDNAIHLAIDKHLILFRTEMKTEINNLNLKIQQLESENKRIKLEIDSLKKSSSSNNNKTEMESTLNVIDEINERKRRENNLIISNFPESSNDDENIIKLIKSMNINNTPDLCMDLKTTRLGHTQNNSRPRLLKATFKSNNAAKTILRNSKQIRLINQYKSVYVNKDLTRRESLLKKHILSEFNKRKSNGENVYLHYHDGIPEIKINANNGGTVNAAERKNVSAPNS